MQESIQPPNPEHDMICPNCGSHHVELNKDVEVTNNHHDTLHQYTCKDCHASFIPAIKESSKETYINKWANKMKYEEGMNESNTWSKSKPDFIIIKPKSKN